MHADGGASKLRPHLHLDLPADHHNLCKFFCPPLSCSLMHTFFIDIADGVNFCVRRVRVTPDVESGNVSNSNQSYMKCFHVRYNERLSSEYSVLSPNCQTPRKRVRLLGGILDMVSCAILSLCHCAHREL